ncbi:MAG: hypothetical protein J7K84_00660 [Deltaproteobacteria bacterium]|nr:hypothetical protein [Deltaproteobacteria bacterium]
MKNRFNFIQVICFIIFFFMGNSLFAIETAPRITDREIIESLAEIKTGQKALKELMGKSFEQIDKRFEQVDKRFEQVDKRFEEVNSRFEQMYNLVLSLFGSLIVLIVAVLGYSIWDRRTVTQEVSGKVEEIERELDIKNIKGSKIERLIGMLKNLSKEDQKLADVLRSFNLL